MKANNMPRVLPTRDIPQVLVTDFAPTRLANTRRWSANWTILPGPCIQWNFPDSQSVAKARSVSRPLRPRYAAGFARSWHRP